MSNDADNEYGPTPPGAGYEHTDVDPSVGYRFALWLSVAMLLSAGLVLVAASVDPEQEKHPWWQAAIDPWPLKWLIPKSLWTSNAEIIPLESELKKMLPLWERIRCPVRVLHATDDRLVPVANTDFIRRMVSGTTDLKMEIYPEGDHFILWSKPAQVRQSMVELIENN